MSDESTGAAAAEVGDSPETAVASKASTPVYFNFVVHAAVQKLLSKGVWCNLGPRFGGLLVRLRAFHVQSVVAKREAQERLIRARLGLADNEEIPAEHQIEITRAAMVMAVTGVKGLVNLGAAGMESQDPEMAGEIEGAVRALVKARDRGFKITEDPDGLKLVVFEGGEKEEHVRDVFAPMIEASITLLTQLFTMSRALQKVKDAEIHKLGEAFVYGAPGEFDWAD